MIKEKKPFKAEDGLYDPNLSIIGSLLGDISWAGKTVKKYRKGGKGFENVLSVEVLQLLYFLPRREFLGEILNSLHTINKTAVDRLIQEIEQVEMNLFPGNYYLKAKPTSHQRGISVQPDGILQTPSIYGLLELKRIKRGSFQRLQLAKEYYLVTRDAKDKIPLLILIIPHEPPVKVQSNRRVDIVDFIYKTLPEVYETADSHHLSLSQLQANIANHVAWITWPEIRTIVQRLKTQYESNASSLSNSINRICDALIKAIDFHS
jgi:hypothetical protein